RSRTLAMTAGVYAHDTIVGMRIGERLPLLRRRAARVQADDRGPCTADARGKMGGKQFGDAHGSFLMRGRWPARAATTLAQLTLLPTIGASAALMRAPWSALIIEPSTSRKRGSCTPLVM